MKMFTLRNAILVAALSCSSAHALEVGRMNVLSGINQPLKALIDLRDVPISEVDSVVGKTADNFGVKNLLPKLTFRPIIEDGQAYLMVTSAKPVKDRVVELLIEVSSPSGHVMRGYSFVLNDIVPADRNDPRALTFYHSQDAEFATAPSAKKIVQAEVEGGRSSSGSITVKKGDTLGKIVDSVIDNHGNVSHEQMMVALFQSNRDKFSGNMNNLKSGVILRVPSVQEVARIDRRKAVHEVHGQLEQWIGNQNTSVAAQSTSALPTASNTHHSMLSIAGEASGVVAADVLAHAKELEESKQRITALEKNLSDVSRLLVLREESSKNSTLIYITFAVSAAFLLLLGFVIGKRRSEKNK